MGWRCLQIVAIACGIAAVAFPAHAGETKAPKPASEKSAVSVNDPKAFQGYTLISPLQSTKTTLVDMDGKAVRTWECNCNPALLAYLLENGNLFRPGKLKSEEQFFSGAGEGGRIQEFTWAGEVVWDFKFHNDKQLPHHDVCKMPNGNVLMLVWDRKSAKESTETGRKGNGNWLYDSIVEVKPTGKTTGEVVWEWHVWDHLIQDHDKTKANFGDVAAHPELIDVNFGLSSIFNFSLFGSPDKKGDAKKDAPKKDEKKDDLNTLKGIGYVGSGKSRGGIIADWPHLNCVTYNAELDQIMVCSRLMSEIWIIDHSTTKSEAASHKGGKHGKGGDLLYRYGNPRAYRAGTTADQRFFTQHNAHWIPKGLPGAGHLLVYNNGTGRPGGNHSSVDELVLPVEKDGSYTLKPGAAFGPEQPLWSYTAPKKSDFYSWIISGTHRLPNGNTLICEGMSGTIFEVTPDKELVWKYKYRTKSAPAPFTGPSKPGHVLSAALQDALKLTEDQKKAVAELQNDVDGKLDKNLAEEQRKQLKDMQDGKGLAGGFPPHGQIFTALLQTRLKLTDEQKQQVAELQKDIDARLAKTLSDEQRKQLKTARAGSGRPFGLGLLGFGDMFGSAVFRAYRYGTDYPGLAGRDLKPLETTGK